MRSLVDNSDTSGGPREKSILGPAETDGWSRLCLLPPLKLTKKGDR